MTSIARTAYPRFKRLITAQGEGHAVDPEDLAHISPYLTEHIRRFGEYSTHELDLEPEAYDPHLDVDCSRPALNRRPWLRCRIRSGCGPAGAVHCVRISGRSRSRRPSST
ncbi:hypothetical protein [Streptomyces sp. NBC_00191]|uniref:hypothetical protein n=1 Tax=Streptomyces sp. NBC_00191 TaxID=2975674 RepID=UPI003863EE89